MEISLFENVTMASAIKDMIASIDKSNIEEEHIFIVPDKYSLIMEKTLLSCFEEGALFNVKVKSLTKFSSMVLEESGVESEIISSGESLLLTQKAIRLCKDRLKYFKKSNISFCYEINKLIAQLKSSLISVEDLQKSNPSNKFQDIMIIFEAYQNLLGGKMDANERMRLAGEKLEGYSNIKNTHFYFAYFDAFTKEGYAFIKAIAKCSASISLTLVTPLTIGNEYIFDNDIYSKVKGISEELEISPKVYHGVQTLSPERESILKGVYSYQKCGCENNGFYNLYSSLGHEEEVEGLAKLIRYRTYKGEKFSDFQVALSEVKKYQSQIEDIFTRYQIPYYIDSTISADSSLMANAIFHFLNCILSGYSADGIVDLISDILLPPQKDTIVLCQTFNVEGKGKYKKYIEKLLPYSHLLSALENAKTSCEIGEVILSICDYIKENHDNVLDVLGQKGSLKEKNIFAQSYDIIKESIALISREEEGTSLGEYYNKLKLLLSFKEVSSPPAFVDAVMIGDATSSGFEEKPYLVILGGEDLPLSSGDNGILSDSELELEIGKSIEPTIRMINRRNRFKLFSLLSLAREGLYVFCQRFNSEGKRNELPTYLKNLNEIFSQKKLRAGDIFFAKNPPNLEWARLVYEEEKDKDYSYLNRDIPLPLGRRMFKGDKVRVTQLENYFSCPFKHFVSYGLSLKEKPQPLAPKDFGNLAHKAGEDYVKAYMSGIEEEEKSFIDKNFYRILKEEDLLEKLEMASEKESLIEFLKLGLYSFLADLKKELSLTSFKPKFIERKFELCLPHKNLTLVGKADRIDEYDGHLRVIDYKTGNVGALLKTLYYGEKIQLFIYQKIACEQLKFQSGGVFYFNAKFDFQKSEEEKTILKGLVKNDDKIILALDHNLSNRPSAIVQASPSARGGFKGSAIYSGDMEKLNDYALTIAERAIEEIEGGYITPKPNESACQWCPYLALCRHEKNNGIRKNNRKIQF